MVIFDVCSCILILLEGTVDRELVESSCCAGETPVCRITDIEATESYWKVVIFASKSQT